MLLADSALPHPFEVMAMKAMTVVVLFLLLLAPPAVSQVPDDKLIVPGQRIGKWTLEMTIDTVLQMNGPRNIPRGIPGTPLDRMRAYFADSNDEIWWHWWADLGFSAATRGRDVQRIEYIFTDNGDFKTDKGVIPEVTTREAVESAYGRPTVVTRAGPVAGRVRLIYDEIGLAVIVRPDGMARFVFVFRPGTARTLWNF